MLHVREVGRLTSYRLQKEEDKRVGSIKQIRSQGHLHTKHKKQTSLSSIYHPLPDSCWYHLHFIYLQSCAISLFIYLFYTIVSVILCLTVFLCPVFLLLNVLFY